MPVAPWSRPFSSVDGISDDDWNASAAQWLGDQGRYDDVAPAPDGANLGSGFVPTNPDVSTALGQAQMPHADWQLARAQQLAARDTEANTEPRLIPVSASSAERIPSAGEVDFQGAEATGGLIGDAAKSVGRFFQRQAVGSNGEPARSDNPVVRWAQQHEGRFDYTRFDTAPDARGRIPDHEGPARGFGEPKCNQFVYDALSAAGAPPGRLDGGRIPMAHDWGDPKSKIAGYAPVDGGPQAGDVVSDGEHVGIYAPLPNGASGTISAASPSWLNGTGGWVGGVVHNDWGFRQGQHVTVWRGSSSRR